MHNLATLIRFSLFPAVYLVSALLTTNPSFSAENAIRYRSHYKAALLADAETGRILHHDRMHQTIYPASLVKMMVALIILEEIKSGRISLQDHVKVSRWASKIGGHQVYLKQGEVFQLAELMKAIVISSANDAAVAVAEHVYGSDKMFIIKMNERAVELGMRETHFYSVHGLPPGRGQELDVSSAYDLYLLALEVLKHPQYLLWSSTRIDSFRKGSFQLLNTNHRLIRNYRGMEGMKTGYHRRAGFNLVSTAKREKLRFVSVVLGATNSHWRSKTTRHLLNYGFNNYLKYELNKKSDSVTFSASIHGGEVEVLIYQLARIELDFSGAASLAFLQGGLSLIGLAILVKGMDRRVEQESGIKSWMPEKLRNRSLKAWFGLCWILLVLIFSLGPLIAIMMDSFRKFENGVWIYTWHWYQELFTLRENNHFLSSLWNSLRIGFGSAMISSFSGLGLVSLIAYRKGVQRRFWELMALFPLTLSTVVFGVAWFYFFQGHLAGTVPLIFVVMAMHALLTCPYWIRIVLPTLENIPTQWHTESKMLGKQALEYGFRILWPWLRRTFLIAFFFSFSLSLGELNSTMMIADDSVRTLPLEIYEAISGYRFSYASAVAVILLLFSATTFLVVERSLGLFGLVKQTNKGF